MKMLESALWILAVLALPRIAAQDSRTTELCKINSNGCSVQSDLIPCQEHFLPACDIHDNCYFCGAHFSLSRLNCDEAFLSDMTALCADGTDEDSDCPAKRKRREASSMSTTPVRQLQLLEKLMGGNSLSDHDPRRSLPRSFTCTGWAQTYYNFVRWFGGSNYNETADATYCSDYEECMPEV
uniref:Ctr_116_T conopeptide n=1 Tax=Conus tribblei TaxID=101761 RepID=A0A0C9S5X4_CONTD